MMPSSFKKFTITLPNRIPKYTNMKNISYLTSSQKLNSDYHLFSLLKDEFKRFTFRNMNEI